MNGNCEQIQDQLAAYVLDALEPSEAEAVQNHLRYCPDCRQIEREYQGVAAGLLGILPREAPSDALRHRVLASATNAKGRQSIGKGATDSDSHRWLTRALAAAALALVVAAAGMAVMLDRSNNERNEAEAAVRTLAAYVGSGGQAVPLKAQEGAMTDWPDGHASLYLADGKPPLLVMTGCPPTGGYYHYRVWMADEGDRTGMGEIFIADNGIGTLVLPDSSLLSMYDSIGVSIPHSDGTRSDLVIGELPTSESVS